MSSYGACRVVVPAGQEPVTGRAFVLLSRTHDPEPRLQRVGWGSVQPLFGRDVESLEGGASVLFDADATGFPVRTLAEVPPGTPADLYLGLNPAEVVVILAPKPIVESRRQ